MKRRILGTALLTLLPLLGFAASNSSAAAADKVVRVGMNEDIDTLDPALSSHFAARLVLTAVCDKLFDIDKDLNFIPRIAESSSWSSDGLKLTIRVRPGQTFHDNTPVDAKAVQYNLDRSRLNPASYRRSELAIIDSIAVSDPLTAVISLKSKSASFMEVVSDIAGVMISPKAAEDLGEKFGNTPVCTGPFKFVNRVHQGKITFDKVANYWDVKNIHVDRVEFVPITDSAARLAALQAGDLDILERMSPTDIPVVEKNSRLKLVRSRETGYAFMLFNVANGPMAELMRDKRIRHAINLSLDREVLAKAAFDGRYVPGGQFFPPGSFYHNDAVPVPKRDVARAKALLKEAGHEKLKFELLTRPDRDFLVPAQIMQSMMADAGIEMLLNVADNVTQLSRSRAGHFQAQMTFWSGRVDPDSNIAPFYSCKGSSNRSKFCNEKYDSLLKNALETIEPAKRKALYNEAAQLFNEELPSLLLWHRQLFVPMRANVDGFVLVPDGLVRLHGVKIQ